MPPTFKKEKIGECNVTYRGLGLFRNSGFGDQTQHNYAERLETFFWREKTDDKETKKKVIDINGPVLNMP